MIFAAVAVLAAVSSASTGTAIPSTMTRDNTSVKSFFLSYFIVFPSFFMHKVFMKLLYALAGLSPCYCFSGHKKRAHQSSLTGIPVFVYSVLDARPPHFALLLQNDRSRPLRRRSSSGYFKSIPSLYASSPFSLLSFPEHPSS